jgi:hypothetical protein
VRRGIIITKTTQRSIIQSESFTVALANQKRLLKITQPASSIPLANQKRLLKVAKPLVYYIALTSHFV